MDLSTYDTALRVGVLGAVTLGVGFVFFGDPALTTAGVILTIVGLMGLMPVVATMMTEKGPDGPLEANG